MSPASPLICLNLPAAPAAPPSAPKVAAIVPSIAKSLTAPVRLRNPRCPKAILVEAARLLYLRYLPLNDRRKAPGMDDRTDRNRAFADQIRHRPAGAPQRRPDAGARRRPLHRRHQPARPGLRGDGAQPATRTASSAPSTPPPPRRCRACWRCSPAPISQAMAGSNARCRSKAATARRSATRRGRRLPATKCASSAIRSPA